MAFQGLSKHEEIARQRLQRDTRTLGERTLATLRSLPAIGMVYLMLVGLVVAYPEFFDIWLIVGLGYGVVPATARPDTPFRIRRSMDVVDHKDLPPGGGKPRRGRGIFLLGNRIEDNAEIWSANEDMRTHVFQIGSTGAGKTEALIGLVFNTMVMGSGVVYLDGKADVKLWGQFFSMARQMGREDDVLVINYMTGNADTTQRRADKLSNSTNPFTTGNAESNTQLLVDLMDTAGSGGDMWKGRAISWLSSLMPPLHELRDQGYINLHVGEIRANAPPLAYFKLMEHPGLSERSRDGMRAFLSTVPGYNPAKKPDQQSSSFLDQYGFQTMQFTRILGSLADTYGHIYSTAAGEVVYKDVVLNRRLLLGLLPALEKSRAELGNLGKINVTAMKSMMGTELGGKLEGSKLDLLDARSTNAPTPFTAIFDEFGYFMPDGAALMWAQARGLGFCLVAAGQDLQAFFRTSREETMAIVANCNLKIVGKLEDPDATYDMVRKIAGQAYTAESEGYEQDVQGLVGGFRSRLGARVTQADRITLQDLKNQVEGEIHLFVKSEIIRARTFYAGPKLAKEFRLNHFVRVLPPDIETIRARRLDVRGLLASLTVSPFVDLKPEPDAISPLADIARSAPVLKYTHQGAERGIALLMALCQAEASETTTAGGEAGGGGLAHRLVPEPDDGITAPAASLSLANAPAEAAMVDQMADLLGIGPAPAPMQDISVHETEDATFDGGRLESTNIFESSPPARSLADQMAEIASAALPMIDTLFDLSKAGGKQIQGAGTTEDGTEVGALDRSETQARLSRIALGLGARTEEAAEVADSMVEAAVHGTSYPVPPKPAATADKQETMESVMSDLEALMTAPGGGS